MIAQRHHLAARRILPLTFAPVGNIGSRHPVYHHALTPGPDGGWIDVPPEVEITLGREVKRKVPGGALWEGWRRASRPAPDYNCASRRSNTAAPPPTFTDLGDPLPPDLYPTLLIEADFYGSADTDKFIDGLLEAFASPEGKAQLIEVLDRTATIGNVKVAEWAQRSTVESDGVRVAFQAKVDQILGPVLKDFQERARLPDGGSLDAKGALGLAATVFKTAGMQRFLPVEVLEMLEEAAGAGVGQLHGVLGRATGHGAVAAILALAISAASHTTRYHQGKVRWDDAVDSVVGDALKAGLTIGIVSAISASFGPGAPVGIAVGVILSPVIYAVVSAVLDHVYDELLGGRLIAEARGVHLDYLEVAEALQQEVWPRLRAMTELGRLVSELDRLSGDGPMRDQARERAQAHLARLVPPAGAMRISSKEFGTQLDLAANAVSERPAAFAAADVGEFLHLSRLAAIEARRQHNLASNFAWVDIAAGVERICKGEAITRGAAASVSEKRFEKIIEGCLYLEFYHTGYDYSRTGLAYFSTFWKDGRAADASETEIQIASSDLAEFTHQLGVIQRMLTTGYKGQSMGKPVLVRFTQVKSKAFTAAKALNHDYVSDLYEDLQRGRARLFVYSNVALNEPDRYVAATATEHAPAEQAKELRRLLLLHNPHFEGRGALLANLRPVENIALVPEATLYGAQVYPVQQYTATRRWLQQDGSPEYVVQDAWFHDLKEAQTGFKQSYGAELQAVRPGPRILSDTLLKTLKAASPVDFFALQNDLMGRVGEGLILLDQLANDSEARLAKLAGVGVVVTFWWTFSKRMRRELISALREGIVQQALRAELMVAMLQLQRVHVLSNPMFRGSLQAKLAEASLEATAEAERKALSAHGPGKSG